MKKLDNKKYNKKNIKKLIIKKYEVIKIKSNIKI